MAAGRFGLAHHLAVAAGDDVHGSILREVALAHSVRGPGSEEAVEAVLLAAEPVSKDDSGSLALRSAGLVRVALLDHTSGASAMLRNLLGSIDGFPQLSALARAVIHASEQNLTVPSTGVTSDVSAALAHAEALASWAEETLARPTRAPTDCFVGSRSGRTG